MRSFGILGVGLAAVLALPAAFAQQSPSLLPPAATKEQHAAVPTVPQPPASPQLTPADLAAWLDGYMPYAIKTGDIAGAVVVIVKDGQVLAERGYGYADVAKRTPVDPQRTLFRPGSVSKLVTWTAVMQLVEQGKLDLDRDVNAYLDFKIPPRDGKPVTLRNIMTHTGGFEEAVKNIMFYDPAKLDSLGNYLKAWTPARIFAPGTTPAYSNYATALAGYIVERVSGQSFDDYVDRNIFAPLGMDHSTFRQPLPKRLAATMSKGYTLGSDEASKYEIVGPAPAGSLASTGADMARFMIAHLEQGELDGKRILQPDTDPHDARFPADAAAAAQSHAVGFLRDQYQRPRGHRATLVTRRISTPRCTCSSPNAPACTSRSTAPARKAPPGRCAPRCSRISPTATSRARRRPAAFPPSRPPSTRAC